MASHAKSHKATPGPAVPEIATYLKVVRESQGAHPYASLLGIRAYDTQSLHRRVKQGLSFEALERLLKVLDLPLGTAARLLAIPPRTLQRRREQGRLQPDESDRLVRLSRVLGLVVELFEGDQAEARRWLGSPIAALGRATPLALLETEPGAREVEDLVGRLEHGVIS